MKFFVCFRISTKLRLPSFLRKSTGCSRHPRGRNRVSVCEPQLRPVRFPLPEWGVRFSCESSSRVLEGRAVTTMTCVAAAVVGAA